MWQQTGQRCARCWLPVVTRLEVGLLVDTGSFVHVDCGGALLSKVGTQLGDGNVN
jgi:hypothetical protein